MSLSHFSASNTYRPCREKSKFDFNLGCPKGTKCHEEEKPKPDDCEPGFNCEVPENTFVCENGTYAYESIACHECPKGSFCTNGLPEVCRNGLKADLAGLSECERCPDGYNCADPKSPYICENGTIPSDDHLLCVDCTAGNFCALGKQTSCKNGTYCDTDAMSESVVCPSGHFCLGGSHKEECGKGKFSKKGSSACEDCIPGQECEGTAQEKPFWCPIGYHCENPSEKQACQPGTMGTKHNLTKCEECPTGKNCENPSKEWWLLFTVLFIFASFCLSEYFCNFLGPFGPLEF